MLYVVSMLQLGQSPMLAHPIDSDSVDRLQLCLQVLSAADDSALRDIWLKDCRQSYAAMIAEKQSREQDESKANATIAVAQADDLIDFYHLKNRKVSSRPECHEA
jgi:coatomer subunit beta